jgi:hypothetical protein
VSGAPCSYSPRQLEERGPLGTAGTQEAPADAGAVLQHHSPPRPASSWENGLVLSCSQSLGTPFAVSVAT